MVKKIERKSKLPSGCFPQSSFNLSMFEPYNFLGNQAVTINATVRRLRQHQTETDSLLEFPPSYVFPSRPPHHFPPCRVITYRRKRKKGGGKKQREREERGLHKREGDPHHLVLSLVARTYRRHTGQHNLDGRDTGCACVRRERLVVVAR